MATRWWMACLVGVLVAAAGPSTAQEADVQIVPETSYKLAIGKVTGIDLEAHILSLPGRTFHFGSELLEKIEKLRVGMAVNVVYERISEGKRAVNVQVVPAR